MAGTQHAALCPAVPDVPSLETGLEARARGSGRGCEGRGGDLIAWIRHECMCSEAAVSVTGLAQEIAFEFTEL